MNLNEALIKYKQEYKNIIVHQIKNEVYILRYLTLIEVSAYDRLIQQQTQSKNIEGIKSLYILLCDNCLLYGEPKNKDLIGKVVYNNSILTKENFIQEGHNAENALTLIDILYLQISQTFPSYKMEDLYKLNKILLLKLLSLSLPLTKTTLEKFYVKLFKTHLTPPDSQKVDKFNNLTPAQQEAIALAENAIRSPNKQKHINTALENQELTKFLSG